MARKTSKRKVRQYNKKRTRTKKGGSRKKSKKQKGGGSSNNNNEYTGFAGLNENGNSEFPGFAELNETGSGWGFEGLNEKGNGWGFGINDNSKPKPNIIELTETFGEKAAVFTDMLLSQKKQHDKKGILFKNIIRAGDVVLSVERNQMKGGGNNNMFGFEGLGNELSIPEFTECVLGDNKFEIDETIATKYPKSRIMAGDIVVKVGRFTYSVPDYSRYISIKLNKHPLISYNFKIIERKIKDNTFEYWLSFPNDDAFLIHQNKWPKKPHGPQIDFLWDSYTSIKKIIMIHCGGYSYPPIQKINNNNKGNIQPKMSNDLKGVLTQPNKSYNISFDIESSFAQQQMSGTKSDILYI
jgi:hypothetical protein